MGFQPPDYCFLFYSKLLSNTASSPTTLVSIWNSYAALAVTLKGKKRFRIYLLMQPTLAKAQKLGRMTQQDFCPMSPDWLSHDTLIYFALFEKAMWKEQKMDVAEEEASIEE